MPKMIQVNCQSCKQPFEARVADRKRGWGKFCSKSCKAKKQASKRMYAPNVTMWRARQDQIEYGGYPQYDRHGNYEGFTLGPGEFSDNFD